MQQMSRTMTLASAAWPRPSVLRDSALVLTGSFLIALLAQLEIPMWPVPVTGQSAGVLLVGAALGARRGALSLIAYLTEGALGLPVFAGGAAGAAHLLGPTGGYLVGFVAAALAVGYLCERGWDRKLWTSVAAMGLGTAVIFAFGLAGLTRFVTGDALFASGLLPFISGAIVKILVAASVLPVVWRMLGRRA